MDLLASIYAMKNFSLTYAGILVAVVGTFLVQAGFSESCTSEIVDKAPLLLEKVPLIVGGLMAWIGRYRVGGVTLAGFRDKRV